MPPLVVGSELLSATTASEQTEPVDPLALNTEIIDYVDRHLDTNLPQLRRAQLLHMLLRDPAFLSIDYDNSETLTAVDVFRYRRANCLSYANLFIALARHYRLDARYQMVEQLPQWGRLGDVMAVTIHVNSVVDLPTRYHLVVDIGGGNAKRLKAPRVINDDEAAALFYNNLAMEAFANGDMQKAYGLIARAIARAPGLGMLWANLGAILKKNEQLQEAESVYLLALKIDDTLHTAYNNLAILYYQSGRLAEHDRALAHIQAIREKNPYYHFALAVQSFETDDYVGAHEHLQRAMTLKADEPMFKTLLDRVDRQLTQQAARS